MDMVFQHLFAITCNKTFIAAFTISKALNGITWEKVHYSQKTIFGDVYGQQNLHQK